MTKLTARNNELKKTVTKTRLQLTTAEKKLERVEARAGRWKSKARALQAAAKRTDARLAELQLPHDGATPEPASAPSSAGPNETTPGAGGNVPDQTWTVARLRAEARARGITGLSNKPKAQLLAALT